MSEQFATADDLRQALLDHLDRTGTTVSACASRVQKGESRGIHRNGAYMALHSKGRNRIGTIIRLLRACGYEVETFYRLRYKPKERRHSLHMN